MTHFTDKPCAAPGLISYRYEGPFGFIMIGAVSDEDALDEAKRSLTGSTLSPDKLQVWDGNTNTYKNVYPGCSRHKIATIRSNSGHT